MRFIDADKLIDDLKGSLFYSDSIPFVEDAPTINAVELPCKVGDIVYMLNIEKGIGRIDAKEVSNIDIEIFSSGNVMIQVWFKTAGFCFGNQFGKVAFLDKHEAGKELIRRTMPK